MPTASFAPRPSGSRLVAACAGGLLMAASFEPFALGVVAPVAVAALAWAVDGVRLREAAVLGYAFGLGFMGVLLLWFVGSIGSAAWIAVVLAEATWFALVGTGIALVLRLWGGPAWAAALWICVELLRQDVPFGGFPWGRIGFSAVDTPWSGLLAYSGVSGTGAGVVLIGILGARAARSRKLITVAALGGVVLVSLVPWILPYTVSPAGTAVVAAVQGGVPGRGNDVGANHRAVTQNQVDATEALRDDIVSGRASSPDFVVWPENSTAVDPFTDQQSRSGIERAVAAVGVPVLVGGIVDGPSSQTVLNQGVVWQPSGPSAERYTKHHPVPFGEWIPFRSTLGGISSRFDEIPRDMLAGSERDPLAVAGLRVADAICFDVAYDDVLVPQVRNGAQVSVVQTSNATFVETDQPAQQFAITRARAVETGRAIVVASLNGVSGVIAPDGQVLQRSRGPHAEVLVERVALSNDLTPAVRWAQPLRLALIAIGSTGGLLGATQAVRRANQSRMRGRPDSAKDRR